MARRFAFMTIAWKEFDRRFREVNQAFRESNNRMFRWPTAALRETHPFLKPCPDPATRLACRLSQATWTGVALVLLGSFFGIGSLLFVVDAVQTEGTVIALRQSQEGTAPTFRYRDRGTEYTVEGGYSSPSKHAVGNRVVVLFKPYDHRRAVIRDDTILLWLPLATTLFGILLIVGAPVIWNRSRHARAFA
jgi:hypothetical protein